MAVGVILWCGFEEPFAHVAVQKVLSSPGTHFYVSLVVCFEMNLEINITWEAQPGNRVIGHASKAVLMPSPTVMDVL